MTTVTGSLTNPDGSDATGLVTHFLVDQEGRPVKNATIAGGTIVGETYTELVSGQYSIVLTGNANIQAPAGVTATYWVRSHGMAMFKMLVPVSGTWDELQIAAIPPPASPAPIATNLITSAIIESPVTGLVVSAFVNAAVPGTIVTVPDLTYRVRIEGSAPILCPATANVNAAGFIIENTLPLRVGTDYQPLTGANLPGSAQPVAVLDPHSAGTYQLYVYAFQSVTLTVDASVSQQAGLWVYAI